MNWLRLHTDLIDNLKAQKLPDNLFKSWINLLCLASIYGGKLPSTDVIAFRLRTTEKRVTETIESLIFHRFLERCDDGTVKPHDWEEWQFQSDDSTARVRRWRKRQCNVSSTVSCNVAQTVTATPSDTDTEQRQKQKAREPALPTTAAGDGFANLRHDAEALVPPDTFTPDDWGTAYGLWNRLDPDQRAVARRNYLDRLGDGRENLTFLKPQLVLRNTEWKRRPPPQPKTRSELADEELERRINAREEARRKGMASCQ